MTSTRTFTVRILRTFLMILATVTLLAPLATTAFAQNPVPFIDQPLVPDAAAPGGAGFTLTVNGAGDTPSYSNAVTQVVTGYPTTTTLSSSLTPSAYGQSVTWTATVTSPSGYVTSPTGKVDFTWGGVYTIGSAPLNASGVATLTKSNLNADSYPLTAAYVGDPNNAGSTSAILSQVVTQTTSAASLTSSPNPSVEGQAVTFLADITSPTITATGPVTFSIGNTVLGTAELAGGKARFTTSTLPVGANPVTVTYSGDSNISGSTASVTEAVQP